MRRLSGFSLMEMMIVLTIVAIVAAASAPMVNKKMVNQKAGASLWKPVQNSSSIYFNDRNGGSVIIGRQNHPAGVSDARLYIDTNRSAGGDQSHIAFGDGGSNIMHMVVGNGNRSVIISDTRPGATATNSVAIGEGSRVGRNSIAIGQGAQATHNNAIAIGSGVQTTANHEIRLGTTNDTVHIPGNLVVEDNCLFGPRNRSRILVRGAASDSGELLAIWNQTVPEGTFLPPGLPRTMQSVDGRNNRGSVNLLGQTYRSDRRLKNVGKSFTGGLEELKKLDLYNFTYKDDKAKTPHVGVMAQDLQKVFPTAVTKDENGFLKIRLEEMFYALINAIKNIDSKTNAQDKRIEELEKQNKELLKRIEALEKK